MVPRTLTPRPTATLFSLALSFVSLSFADAPRATILETKVISQQPEYYHGWPTVVRRQNGDLWVSWSGGRESHVCPFGQVHSMTSYDEGKTWTREVVLRNDGGGRDLGYPRSVQRADGKVVTAYYFNDDPKQTRYIVASIWNPATAEE